MTNYSPLPIFDINKYVWGQLKNNNILSENDYYVDELQTVLTPIVPAQQIPEFNNLLPGQTYLIYDYEEKPTMENWWISEVIATYYILLAYSALLVVVVVAVAVVAVVVALYNTVVVTTTVVVSTVYCMNLSEQIIFSFLLILPTIIWYEASIIRFIQIQNNFYISSAMILLLEHLN